MSSLDGTVYPRRLAAVVASRLRAEPVIALHGPRTVGKSTLLTEVAAAAQTLRIDLDDAATRAAAAADPALFASGPSPICIDEYQHVPELLSAIKAELNSDLRPGRFILTGSTTYSSIPLTAQSLTGRLHLMTVWPLSQGEIDGTKETLISDLFDLPGAVVTRTPSSTSREEYATRVLRGGMPLALLRHDQDSRNRWFDDYVRLVVERDVVELSKVRQREALPRLLTALAAQAGQLLVVRRAAQASGLEPSTAESYTQLLESAFMIHRLPAWGTTLGSRAGRTPKIHLVDSGLAARMLGLSMRKLEQRNPSALSEFGHVLESFVVNEAMKQISWQGRRITAGHYRNRDGVEVDLVLEDDEGRVVGIEVKASNSPSPSDFGALRRLQEVVGERFVAGVLFHLGPRSFAAGPGLYALPVDRLWAGL